MEKKQGKPELITLVLRLMGGGYLVYLAFQLLPELKDSSGSRNLIQWVSMITFFIVGGLLAGWSAKKLIRKEFIHKG